MLTPRLVAFFVSLILAIVMAEEPLAKLQNATRRLGKYPQMSVAAPLLFFHANGTATAMKPNSTEAADAVVSLATTTTSTSTSITASNKTNTIQMPATESTTSVSTSHHNKHVHVHHKNGNAFVLNSTGIEGRGSLVITDMEAKMDLKCECTQLKGKSGASGLHVHLSTVQIVVVFLLTIKAVCN